FVSDNMIERFPRFPAYNAARRLMFGSALPKMFSIIKEENLLSVDQINNMLNIISNALCVDNDDHKKECFDFLSIVYTQNVIDKAQIDTFFIRVNDFLISNLTISRIETLYLIIEENKFSSDQTGKLIQSMRQKMKDFGRNDVEQCIKLVSLMVNKELITIEEMNSLEPVIFAEFKLQFKQLQARLEAKVNAHVVEKQAEMKKNQTDNDLGSELNESARMRDERESKAVYDVMLSRKVDRTIEHSVEA
ncbi:hypothetical protein KBD08_04625, partial [Candidatus Babeliales bacterium]|nr:hypothetical protein [Candidatus Babeliales bacterium]